MSKFYGKYRGKVDQNIDPEQRGRIQVTVADVVEKGWAMPCVPYTGKLAGFYAIPAVGSYVWVEFEGGNPDYPIWTGCFWMPTDLPPALALATPATVPHIHLQTPQQNAIIISDVPGPTGGIMLKSATGKAMIIVNDTHILITNGTATIEMIGKSVIINQGALAVDFL